MKPCMEIWKEEYLAQDGKYENHVSKFIDYLMIPTIDKANQPATISTDDLFRCVGYYVKCGKINSIKSMESHLESVKAFYKFLITHGYVSENIVPSANYPEFKLELSETYNLKETVAREWFADDEIKTILDTIDNYFTQTQYDSLGKEGKERYFHWISVRIYIKLSLIAPAKKSVLLSSVFSDFSPTFRNVRINDVNIKIPNGLRINILNAIGFIKSATGKTFAKADNFFYYLSDKIGGESDPKGTLLNQWFYSFLKVNHVLDIPQNLQSYPVDKIANTTIHNMVTNGANLAYISKLAGIDITSLKKYFEGKEFEEYYKSSELVINNEIAKCEYYNYI